MSDNPKVYIETTIVSYLTAWPSRDVIRLSHEVLTRQWWQEVRPRCELYTSELVHREAGAGDPTAAAERIEALKDIPLLAITPEVTEFAKVLAADLALPRRASADAVHLAAAAVHGTEFLLTWNCRHLANAVLWDKIETACLGHGVRPPRVVTPEQLMEIDHGR